MPFFSCGRIFTIELFLPSSRTLTLYVRPSHLRSVVFWTWDNDFSILSMLRLAASHYKVSTICELFPIFSHLTSVTVTLRIFKHVHSKLRTRDARIPRDNQIKHMESWEVAKFGDANI